MTSSPRRRKVETVSLTFGHFCYVIPYTLDLDTLVQSIQKCEENFFRGPKIMPKIVLEFIFLV